jgi:hypothetical protein
VRVLKITAAHDRPGHQSNLIEAKLKAAGNKV